MYNSLISTHILNLYLNLMTSDNTFDRKERITGEFSHTQCRTVRIGPLLIPQLTVV